jgi:hypothetical protein
MMSNVMEVSFGLLLSLLIHSCGAATVVEVGVYV